MKDEHSASLEKKLSRIERAVRSGRLVRFLLNPAKYLYAIGYWRLIYPLRKKGRFAKAKTFFGAEMEVVLPAATEIFLLGAKTHNSEIRMTKFLMKNLKPGDVFVDVGAHFGFFSLLAAHLTGKAGKVFTFEASRSNFQILQKNTAAVPQISAFHKAVSDTGESLTFHEFPVLFSEYNSLVLPENQVWLRQNPPQRIEVEAVRLDEFFAEREESPAIVKIDVEGAELQVLKGMEKLFQRRSPTLLMEFLSDKGKNSAYRQAVQFVKNFGYQTFLIENSGEILQVDNLDETLRLANSTSENIVLKKL